MCSYFVGIEIFIILSFFPLFSYTYFDISFMVYYPVNDQVL